MTKGVPLSEILCEDRSGLVNPVLSQFCREVTNIHDGNNHDSLFISVMIRAHAS